jgi:threonine aldolase
VAEILGLEAALFTPSGTMANQIAMRILAPPGTEVLMEERSHNPFHFEMAGMAALSGLLPRPIPSPDGILRADAVRAAVQPGRLVQAAKLASRRGEHHNLWGGKVYRRADIDPLLDAARGARLAAHLDGARIWNAAVATGGKRRRTRARNSTP